MLLRILFCYLVASPIAVADAENWNQFRGPHRNGHTSAVGLPVEWSNERNVAWKVSDVGEGWSSPVVWENRIYLTAARPLPGGEASERNLVVLCLDANDGSKLWEQVLFVQTKDSAQRIHNKNSHASPTPIVDGAHLWAHFGAQGTACVTLDGEVVWKRDDISYQMQHGNGGSPVVVDDILFFSCDGSQRAFVIALDRRTGETRWEKERPPVTNPRKFSFNTPAVIELDGQTQILSQGSDIMTAFDPKSGDELWWFRYDGYSVIPQAVFAHGLVFVCTSYNNSKLHAVDPGGRGDLTDTAEVWNHPRNIPHTPSLIVVGDEVYAVSDRGIATCFDAKTGEVHWSERIEGNYSASPIASEGKIYFLAEDGTATVIEAGTKLNVLAKNRLGERTLASFAVIENNLLIRTAEHLYRIK
jgi:outer membrane protein assembly factor BamB